MRIWNLSDLGAMVHGGVLGERKLVLDTHALFGAVITIGRLFVLVLAFLDARHWSLALGNLEHE